MNQDEAAAQDAIVKQNIWKSIRKMKPEEKLTLRQDKKDRKASNTTGDKNRT